jgi:gamma-glutamylcyclotransferase (GGCT)/AIG2-like uncharacterized protein YtfP
MTAYFAYGANMDPAHVARVAPAAHRLGTAVLPGFAFCIVAGGYGDLVAAPDREIHGVLWELNPEDEAGLDAFEGVPEGLYHKEFVTVRDGSGRAVRAMLYRAVDKRPGVPVPGYVENIIETASALGFPAGYVDSLCRLLRSGEAR